MPQPVLLLTGEQQSDCKEIAAMGPDESPHLIDLSITRYAPRQPGTPVRS